MKVIKPNWYGFNHDEVAKRFSGGLTYKATFCVKGEYAPVSVYRAENPDTSKGHKRYMLLQMQGKSGLVRGMSEEDMETERWQRGIHCLQCDEVHYSVNRHDFHACSCGNITIDGGKDYLHYSTKVKLKSRIVDIDLLTDEVKELVWQEDRDEAKPRLPKVGAVARLRERYQQIQDKINLIKPSSKLKSTLTAKGSRTKSATSTKLAASRPKSATSTRAKPGSSRSKTKK